MTQILEQSHHIACIFVFYSCKVVFLLYIGKFIMDPKNWTAVVNKKNVFLQHEK